MTRVERSIEIGTPPEKVWEMLALDRLPEYTYRRRFSFGRIKKNIEDSNTRSW